MARLHYLVFASLLASTALSCEGPFLEKRQSSSENSTASPSTSWAYDESYDWGELDPAYELCQTGMQQAPIPLSIEQGLSQRHLINFTYPGNISGSYYNWGYGPAFELGQDAGCTVGSQATNCINLDGLPYFTFEEEPDTEETVYLVSWHIHAPADHTVQGDRSKAELHFVHVDNQGHERAVLAFRIDPGLASYSAFLAQLPFASSSNGTTGASQFPSFNDTESRIPSSMMDPGLAVDEVRNFNEFWTYRGSLTSPPCTEGIRFFIARQVLFSSNEQMRDILRVSTFSAREEQEVWMHEINV